MLTCQLRVLAASTLAFGLAGTAAFGETEVSKDRIVFGQVVALDGPAQALGQGMREGTLAAFGEANRAGGTALRTGTILVASLRRRA
jgi:branched-chain amino acid transport system substrate-binding protein